MPILPLLRSTGVRRLLTVVFALSILRTVLKTRRLILVDRALVDARLAEESPAQGTGPARTPPVSVLVAAWNEAPNLPRLIQSFESLPYAAKELVLCAGGTDGSLAVAMQHAGPLVRVVEQAAGDGKQRALQKALEIAGGDILFLTDADCVLDGPSFLRTLAPVIDEGEAAADGTYAPLRAQRDAPLAFYRWCFDNFASVNRGRYLSAGDVNGVNFAIRRSALMEAGGFEPEARTGEDYHLASRLLEMGCRIRNVPGSEVEAEYATSAVDYIRQVARWQRSTILLALKFGRISETTGVVRASAAGAGFFTLPLLLPFLGVAALYGWLFLLANCWGQRLRYFLLTRRFRGEAARHGSFIPALAFVILDLAAWTLAVVQILCPPLRDEW